MHAVSVRRHAERGSCEARQQDAARRPRDGVGESFFAATCGLAVQVPKVSVPGLTAVAPTARSSEVGGAQEWTPAPPPAEGKEAGSRRLAAGSGENSKFESMIKCPNEEAGRFFYCPPPAARRPPTASRCLLPSVYCLLSSGGPPLFSEGPEMNANARKCEAEMPTAQQSSGRSRSLKSRSLNRLQSFFIRVHSHAFPAPF
jgi:hypothetical protein